MPRIQPSSKRIVEVEVERYVDTDDEGYEEVHRPKWTKPSSAFQHELLGVVGRKYYLKREERSRVIAIEKAMMSIAETRIASLYPTEWVNVCIAWARDMRRKGNLIKLMALLNLICNQERRAEFVSDWTRKNGAVSSDQSTAI